MSHFHKSNRWRILLEQASRDDGCFSHAQIAVQLALRGMDSARSECLPANIQLKHQNNAMCTHIPSSVTELCCQETSLLFCSFLELRGLKGKKIWRLLRAKVLLEKLIVSQLIEKFLAFMESKSSLRCKQVVLLVYQFTARNITPRLFILPFSFLFSMPLSSHLSIYLSIHPSVCLSVCLCTYVVSTLSSRQYARPSIHSFSIPPLVCVWSMSVFLSLTQWWHNHAKYMLHSVQDNTGPLQRPRHAT
jgi:hypothetical protein